MGQQTFSECLLVIAARGGYLLFLFLLNCPRLEPTLQGNQHIRGALVVALVGILRVQVAKAGRLSGMNNLMANWRLSFLTIAN